MENEDNNSNGEAVPPKEDTQPDHLSGSHDGSLAIENLRCQENKAKTLYQKNFASLSLVALFSISALLAVVVGVEEAVRIQLVSLKSKEAENEISTLRIRAQETKSELARTKSQIPTLEAEEKDHLELLQEKERKLRSLRRELSRIEEEDYLPELYIGHQVEVTDKKVRHIPGNNGTILHYTEGRWAKHPQSDVVVQEDIYSLWLNSSGTQGWAVGDEGTILEYKDDQWTKHPQSSVVTTDDIYHLSLDSSGTKGWAVGNNGALLEYKNGQWAKHPQSNLLTQNYLNEISLDPSGTQGWAIGDNGTILQYKDSQWTKHPQSNLLTENEIYSIWINYSGAEGWAVGNNGTILQYKDNQWTAYSQPNFITENFLSGVRLDSSGKEGWIVGKEGTILQYKDDKWTKHPQSNLLTKKDINSLWLDSSGTEGWASGEDGLILEYNKSLSWTAADPELLTAEELEAQMFLAEEKREELTFFDREVESDRNKAGDYAAQIAKLKELSKSLEIESTDASALVKATQTAASKIKQPSSDNVQQSITRGGAIAGAIGIAIFLMQIFLSNMRYYAKLAELYASQITALQVASGNNDLFIALVDKLSPQIVDFGPAPTHLYSQILEALKDMPKSIKVKP